MTFTRGFDSFPNGSFCINNILVDFSTIVSMACWAGSTIKSISKSPNLFPSTSLLLSWILTLSFIGRCPPLGRACISSYDLCALQASLLCHCGWCYRWTGGIPLYPHSCADTLIFVLETTGRWKYILYLYCWLFLFPLREMQMFSTRSERLSASLGEGHSFIALRFGTCKPKILP